MKLQMFKNKFFIIGSLSTVVAVIVLIGWICNITIVQSFFVSGSTMKFNTAICFALLGLTMICFQFRGLGIAKPLYKVFSWVVLIIALFSLSEFIFNRTSIVNELFVTDNASRAAGISHPGLMSPLTSFCFSLISFALLGTQSTKRYLKLISQYALHLATFISSIALFGYIFQAPTFYQFSFFTSMAVHTALLIFVISVTSSFIQPKLGITSLFVGDLTGHILIRRLFLLFTFSLVVINFVTIQLITKGILEYHFGIVLSAFVAIIVFLSLISFTAQKLNLMEIRRQKAEDALQLLNKELEIKVVERNKQLKTANEKLNEQNQTLEIQNASLGKANAELSTFAHMASHDLQAPLRKIGTFISIIEKENIEQLSVKSVQSFGRIKYTADRMRKLIEDLLNFSIVDNHSDSFKPTDMDQLLKNVLNELAELIAEKNATVQSVHLPVVKGIPFQLIQLFTNLITNSIKYSKENIPPYITITTELVGETFLLKDFPSAKGNYHQIQFEDNGIGFATENRFKIFEIFQRLHTNRSYTGSGIGLAICKKVMDNHNGFITAESQPNMGSKFTVYFPV